MLVLTLFPRKLGRHSCIKIHYNIDVCYIITITHRTNEDDFLPVDLAAMLNHQAIVRLLLEKGGKDSAKCKYLSENRCTNITCTQAPLNYNIV